MELLSWSFFSWSFVQWSFAWTFLSTFLGNADRCCQIYNPLDQKESRRCGIGEGHCDYDEDCMEGLVCGSCNCPGDEWWNSQGCADCCTYDYLYDEGSRLDGSEADKEGRGTEAEAPETQSLE